jgi:hypothetical protein
MNSLVDDQRFKEAVLQDNPSSLGHSLSVLLLSAFSSDLQTNMRLFEPDFAGFRQQYTTDKGL